jgi:hypothetical protein
MKALTLLIIATVCYCLLGDNILTEINTAIQVHKQSIKEALQ